MTDNKAVNVVFDEVELYFYPELQRKFIKTYALPRIFLKSNSGRESVT